MSMQLNTVGVTAKNLKKSVQFYTLLGFKLPEFKGEEQHLETTPEDALWGQRYAIVEDPDGYKVDFYAT